MNRLILLILFVSCESKNKNNVEENNKIDTIQKTVTKEILVKDTLESNSTKSLDDLGFELMGNETLNELKLGLELNQVEKILGQNSYIGTNELWEADGAYHQTFHYKSLGIELDMIGDEKKDKKINMITINQPCDFKTIKNISIGSTYKEVEKSYKKYYNKDFSNPNTFVAGSIYGGVIFNFEKGKVSSIFIGAAAE